MTLNWLSNMITSINVAIIARDQYVRLKRSQMNLRILHVFYQQGVISYFNVEKDFILLGFKYNKNKCVIKHIKRVSLPSRKIYLSTKTLDKYYRRKSFIGFYLLSTSSGFITSNEALLMSPHNSVSGEVILKVYLS